MVASKHRRPSSPRARRAMFGVLLTAALIGLVGTAGWAMFGMADAPASSAAATASPSPVASAASPAAAISSRPSPSPSATPAGPLVPFTGVVPGKLLIGIGDEADRAAQTALAKQSPVKMLTSWYNEESDFGDFMDGWKKTLIPKLYRSGYAIHVVEWAPDDEGQLTTKYGPACGRAYPLSSQFLNDMKHLAQIFGGARTGPPFYVTLFTEFSTYPCVDNEWDSATNYYLALKDQYRAAYQVLHANAANVHVSLGFGGWLGTYDYPQKGGGKSLISHFTDILKASDFQSFQAMNDPASQNPAQILAMTKILHPYGPVMLAHYKPDNGNQATFDADVRAIFTDSFIQRATADGLFAMSFMTTKNVDADPATFQFLKTAVTRYGRTP
ncbi:hypothetical protein [Rugosimonospora africana]|nr:hypothetical protein [Rugosimonospora africana]